MDDLILRREPPHEGGEREGDRRIVRSIGALDRHGGAPLYRLLYRRIRDLIASGALPPGARLPPSRVLAQALALSRNTATAALEQLTADGWTESRRGSGVYVADKPPGRGRRAVTAEAPAAAEDALPFSVGAPALDLFPLAAWNRLQSRRWRRMPLSGLSASAPLGWPGLREAISAHLAIGRGLIRPARQIIVTTNVRAGVELAVRALGLRGATALVEDPGYFGFREALQANGVTVATAPVDRHGLDLAAGLARHPEARLAVVTPACQFPTGAVMSGPRRRALIEWAARGGGYVFEEDFEYEALGLAPPPVAALVSIPAADIASNAADADRVIYFNSFNRLLFPNLKVAYLAVPESLVDSFARAAKAIEAYGAIPNQMVLADFINEGLFDDHLRRSRQAWSERRAALTEAIESRLAGRLSLHEPHGGLHLVADLHGVTETEALSRAAARGVDLTPMGLLGEAARRNHQVLLGFAAFEPGVIRAAADRLAAALGEGM